MRQSVIIHEKATATKMNLIILLLLICITNGASTDKTRDCSNYDRKVTKPIGKHKTFVNCLGRDMETGQSDMVIMLDRSGSMSVTSEVDGVTLSGYQIAKNFITSLLSEVKISRNATRIAVVTFASDHSTDIDFLRNPVPANNKCEFNKKFEKLTKVWGMTNIRGAMDRGYKIFTDVEDDPVAHSPRKHVNRVALLLSDGQANTYEGSGNARDASPEANKMKSDSIILYTVAATSNSDHALMESWATVPSAALYAETFDKMKVLAHNIRGGKSFLVK